MLVANGHRYFTASLREYTEQWGSTDEEHFRWSIGEWEYPGGLAPSSSEEQMEFDAAWTNLGRPTSGAYEDGGDDRDQEQLEELCIRVLRRLIAEKVFAPVRRLEGFMILGADDPLKDVLPKKKRLAAALKHRD